MVWDSLFWFAVDECREVVHDSYVDKLLRRIDDIEQSI